jgi:3D (Asp-Asp-Asp) domain-containing protein
MMKPTVIQRSAEWLFVSTCCLLCAGVATAAAVRVVENRRSAPHGLPWAHPQSVEVVTDPVAPALAGVELLRNVDEATPIHESPAQPKHLAQSTRRSSSRAIWMLVTAYCPCEICCGENASGVTASGKRVSYNHSRFVAADTSRLPFGTKLRIPGYDNARSVEVIDRGGAIEGNHIDVFFKTHDQAMEWGKRWMKVIVAE